MGPAHTALGGPWFFVPACFLAPHACVTMGTLIPFSFFSPRL